jgi:hypothetical protein
MVEQLLPDGFSIIKLGIGDEPLGEECVREGLKMHLQVEVDIASALLRLAFGLPRTHAASACC